jgi:hypothetical protein
VGTFSVAKDSVTLSTAADAITLVPAAAHPIRIVEISIGGMGTASAANSLGVYRSTSGTTPGGAITPTAYGRYSSTNPPVSNTVANTTYSVAPTLTGTYALILPVNSNGGIYRWVARPGEEIVVANADQLSLRPLTGTGVCSIHVVWEEDFL